MMWNRWEPVITIPLVTLQRRRMHIVLGLVLLMLSAIALVCFTATIVVEVMP